MWEAVLTRELAILALFAVFGALLGVAFSSLKDWALDRISPHRSIRIAVAEEKGPTIIQYGFTEKAVKVTVKNGSSAKIEIRDIRLMFAGSYGAPVLPEAPQARSHRQLPAALESGISETWYFPAEKLASLISHLSAQPISTNKKVKLRPRITTTTGRIFRGPTHQFSIDVDSHWP